MFCKNVRNINASVSAEINHKWRAIVQLGTLQQLCRVVDLGPRSLPCRPGLHVTGESFKASGGFLQSPKEVETVGVTV